jgi:hypothetical protein
MLLLCAALIMTLLWVLEPGDDHALLWLCMIWPVGVCCGLLLPDGPCTGV